MVSGLALWQIMLHLCGAWEAHQIRLVALHGLAFVYDVIIVLPVYKLACRLVNYSRISKLSIFAISFVLASYPLMLTEYINFPVNVFTIDWSVASMFFTWLIGSKCLFALFGSLLAPFLALKASSVLPIPTKSHFYYALMVIALIGLLGNISGSWWLHTVPHPIVHSLQEVLRDTLVRGPRMVPHLRRPVLSKDTDDNVLPTSPFVAKKLDSYDHIVLLVMETVNESDFAREFTAGKDGFYGKVRDRSLYFSNYYTTNLDSYTSLLAMLTAVQVPYMSYDKPAYYDGVNSASNMVRSLKEQGWRCLFVCTAKHQPFIPVWADWSAKTHGSDIPDKDWVSLGVNRIEAAVEDKAASETIINFIKKHSKTFILQEMVYGHSKRWMMKTGTKQLAYYDDYFHSLYERVKELGLEDRTLFVIATDHGQRREDVNPCNYKVPLLVAGHSIKSCKKIDEQYCHLDLQEILAHVVYGSALPKRRSDVIVVGHSGRWTYGRIKDKNNYIFLDCRGGDILSQAGNYDPLSLYSDFQEIVDSFARYQRLPIPPGAHH